ncbi:SRPBCC family protein [Maribius pontilimi]|uniref:SRPBCC family protein n=1 Tax=Palleronia pontilimi TaxID=1964209 RepID=A0A934I8Y1_9RHOB|nr:SRPBCC family protein [Palleronia pontilimi]MBJ3762654.1 SRPBCC family protein [Palleronia pontilimi]
MKISTRRDVDLPADQVFDAISDFDTFEERARDKGASVARLDDGREGKAQARWRIGFEFRGRRRLAEARVVTYDTDKQLAMKGETDGVDMMFNVELLEVAPNLTRLFVSIDLRPRSITGRLLVQSLKLAKSALTRRLDKRLGKFAKTLEQKHGPARA